VRLRRPGGARGGARVTRHAAGRGPAGIGAVGRSGDAPPWGAGVVEEAAQRRAPARRGGPVCRRVEQQSCARVHPPLRSLPPKRNQIKSNLNAADLSAAGAPARSTGQAELAGRGRECKSQRSETLGALGAARGGGRGHGGAGSGAAWRRAKRAAARRAGAGAGRARGRTSRPGPPRTVLRGETCPLSTGEGRDVSG